MTQHKRIKPGAKRNINEGARSPLEPGTRKSDPDDADSRLIAGGTPVPSVNPLGVRLLTEEEVEALFDNMPV